MTGPTAPRPPLEAGRRRPRRLDGSYVNPILGGDYPDPSILKVDRDYYLTHSSFNWSPGLLIWHSRDLVRWRPLTRALSVHDGDIWAPELIRHQGRFFIYYKTTGGNHVVTADDILGPWSAPTDIGIGWIDPGHVVGPDGTRYVHVSDGYAAQLSPDGLRVVGEPRKVYGGWPIPPDWHIEGVCLEGPKFVARDGWYHLFTAQGGTAGPATSHMVLHARSRSPMGPFENSPHNPIIHTAHRGERWWSRGHGTPVEGPDGRWWMTYHAYEKGYHTLGRQTLLEPVEWTADGWLRATVGAHPERALPVPGDQPPGPDDEGGLALSDDFRGRELGLQWRFWGEYDRARFTVGDGRLVLQAKGEIPNTSAPLACIPTEHAYEAEVSVERLDPGAHAAMLLFYDPRHALGLATGDDELRCSGANGVWGSGIPAGRRIRLRILNDHHEVLFRASVDGGPWRTAPMGCETSGWHHNTCGGFLSLRIALAAFGSGRVAFSDFRYRALD